MTDSTNLNPTEGFRYLAIAAALALEINTGLSHSRGSVMNVARELCGSPRRTKRGVLKDYVAWLPGALGRPDYTPNPSVTRALGN